MQTINSNNQVTVTARNAGSQQDNREIENRRHGSRHGNNFVNSAQHIIDANQAGAVPQI